MGEYDKGYEDGYHTSLHVLDSEKRFAEQLSEREKRWASQQAHEASDWAEMGTLLKVLLIAVGVIALDSLLDIVRMIWTLFGER